MRRPGDKTPEPAGGRAAERLRMYLDARRAKPAPKKRINSPKGPKKAGPAN